MGVPAANAHAYQSPLGKAETVSASGAGGPVVTAGDYVNDRLAFERADRAALVRRGADTDPTPDRVRPPDEVVGSLSDVITRL